MCQGFRDVVRRQDVVDRERASSKVWLEFASAPYFVCALANSSLRKVSGPVCCGEKSM